LGERLADRKFQFAKVATRKKSEICVPAFFPSREVTKKRGQIGLTFLRQFFTFKGMNFFSRFFSLSFD
jgi:hypothetical protein